MMFLILLLTLAPQTDPEIADLTAPPVEGQAVALVFTDAGGPVEGLAVSAVYRPNAHESITSTEEIGTTDGAGQVSWTPRQPGVVTLSWEGGSKNLSVKHDGAPPLGVFIAILAGVLLLGGSAVFFTHMVRQGGVGFEEKEPPST